MCAVTSVSMWYPDDNYAAGGYWETQYITKCTHNPGDGGSTNPNPEQTTYPYPGGGGNNGGNNSIPNPCLQQKSQSNDPIYKDKIDNLQGKTSDTSEQGFRVGNPVPNSGQTGAQYQQLSNKPGTKDLDFKIFNTTTGIMHSHYDGLYPMFSPQDIILSNQLLINALNNNIPLSDVFLTVVTSQGNYQLRYVGISINALTSLTDDDIKSLNKTYQDDYLGNTGNQQKYEEGFLKFMKDKLNVSGVKLYQNKDNGNAELTLNSNNKLNTPTPCP